MDTVDNSVDNHKIKEKRGKILWKTFVDTVDNFLTMVSKVEKNFVELCKLYNP